VSASADGFIAVGAATGSPRGLAVFFSGGYGTGWWGAGSDLVQPWLGDIRASGLETVLVEWKDSWLVSSPGEKAGVAALACRPSTAVKWVHDHLYVPLGIPPGPGECGFCITGNSGGSSQVSYALSFYGEDRILNADFPTSGPPHGAINKGCIRGAPNPQRYWYTTWAQGVMDSSYGFHEDPIHGPCYLQDPAYVDTWKADSVAKGGNDYSHPSTRVGFIIGGKDGSVAPAHARDYYNKLVKVGGSLAVNWTVVPEMPHSITNSPEGLAELRAELLATG